MLKFLISIWLFSNATWSADSYIAAHILHHPQVVKSFIEHLPKHQSLLWKAWWHLQQENYDEANRCYTILAESDEPQGYRGLADSYLAGHGVVQNTELALVLYEKAATMGLGAAQINAAVLCADKHDWPKAECWFKQALSNPNLFDMKESLEALYQRRMKEKK